MRNQKNNSGNGWLALVALTLFVAAELMGALDSAVPAAKDVAVRKAVRAPAAQAANGGNGGTETVVSNEKSEKSSESGEDLTQIPKAEARKIVRPVAGSAVFPRHGEPQIVRRGRVHLEAKTLAGLLSSLPSFPPKLMRLAPGQRSFTIELFEDTRFEAVIESVQPSRKGGYIVRGQIKDVEFGTFSLVQENGATIADFSAGPHIYELRKDRKGAIVQQIDPSRLPADDPEHGSQAQAVINHQPGREEESAYAEALAAADGEDVAGLDAMIAPVAVQDAAYTTIDILVVYTPSALTAVGGTASVESFIQMAVDKANQTYQNSLINQRLRLVGTLALDKNGSGSASTDLQRLSGTSDGTWDNVHAARARTGADMVAMLTTNLGSGVCGIGYLNSSRSSAFSATKTSCVSNHSFTHEVGHNMGAAHDRANAGSAPFSYGYGYIDSAHGFRTVMAYPSGSTVRVAYFSNPLQTYKDAPTGTANANNALVLNNTREKMAGLLAAVTEAPPAPVPVPNPNPEPAPNPVPVPPPPASACGLKVLAPNGGETLARGRRFQARWSTGAGINRVALMLVQNAKVVAVLDRTEPNDGIESLSIDVRGSFKLRVQDRDNPNCFDESDGTFAVK